MWIFTLRSATHVQWPEQSVSVRAPAPQNAQLVRTVPKNIMEAIAVSHSYWKRVCTIVGACMYVYMRVRVCVCEYKRPAFVVI